MSITNALKDPTTGQITVSAHGLTAGMQLWAEGFVTKSQVMQGVGIPPDAESDIDEMAAVYQGKASEVEKLAYVNRLERCAIILQDGTITPADFRSFMELSA